MGTEPHDLDTHIIHVKNRQRQSDKTKAPQYLLLTGGAIRLPILSTDRDGQKCQGIVQEMRQR